MTRYEVFEIKRHAVQFQGGTWTEIELKNLSVIVTAVSPEQALDDAKNRFPRKPRSLAVAIAKY